jgi:hypothetical protein
MVHLRLVGSDEAEQRMYGCAEAEVKASIDQRVDACLGNPNLALSAILDTAAKALGEGKSDEALHLINRVKLGLVLADRLMLWARLT